VCARVCACMRKYVCMCACMRKYVCMCACMRTYVRVRVYVCKKACPHSTSPNLFNCGLEILAGCLKATCWEQTPQTESAWLLSPPQASLIYLRIDSSCTPCLYSVFATWPLHGKRRAWWSNPTPLLVKVNFYQIC